MHLIVTIYIEERQIHHYGSGLNALPSISEFATSPTDYFLLD